MKNLILIILIVFCCNILLSQESIVFDKQFLINNQGNSLRDLKQTSDGGFICAGGIGFSMYDDRYLLFKTDSLGNLEWYNYSDSSAVHSKLWAVDITKTGNYVGIGRTMDNPDWHQSGAIVMYDNSGDTIWTKQYAFTHPTLPELKSEIIFLDGIFSDDNSIVAVGSIIDGVISTDPNPLIVKTDMQGDTLWTWRLYNDENTIVVESIAETEDGDYIAVGRARMPILEGEKTYAPERGFIVKLSQDGELIYLKEWTDVDFNYFKDIAINQEGEFIISGGYFLHPPSNPDDEDYGLLLKTDSFGNTIFYKQIIYGKGLESFSVNLTQGDNIVCLSMFIPPLSFGWQHDVLLEKYSGNGECLWTKYIGGANITNWPYSVISTSNNGIAFCGLYGESGSNNLSWLVKTDSLGNGTYNEGWINEISTSTFNHNITVFPNPAADKININIENNMGCVCTIYSLDGKIIKKININSFQNQIEILSLHNGIYLLEISDNKHRYIEKIIINH